MGIHSELNNRDSSKRSRSRHKMNRRRVDRRVNRGRVGRVTAEVANPELASAGMIRKRKQNSRTNVTLSGKKKRRMMKQIKYLQKDQAKIEVEIDTAKPQGSKEVEMVEVAKKIKKGKKTKSVKKTSPDIDMEEDT